MFHHDDSVTSDVNITFTWRRLYDRVKLMLMGHSDTLPRTASLVQVLGNMTVVNNLAVPLFSLFSP